ncbi:MAG: cell wall hydrolase [Hyphomonadaceae bacterium]
MVELERNPLAVRQGAAAVACMAAAAVAMPVISHRAAEQREGADWSARQIAFQTQMRAQEFSGRAEPDARVQLTTYRAGDGLRARGSAFIYGNFEERAATQVHAVLRGPFQAAPAAPSTRGPDALNQRELHCLSEAIYFEARSESYRGQVAVAEVVMNRVRSSAYPNSICGVVYQGHQRATGCQFTFTCDGSLGHRPRGRAWERAQNIAAQVMLGYTRSVTGRATHYHTHAVNPVWNAMLVRTVSVGDHVFYRFPNRAERAALLQTAAGRRAQRATEAAIELEAAAAADAATPAAVEQAAPRGRVQGVIPATPEAEAAPAEEAAPPPEAIEASAPPTDEEGGSMEVST